MTKCVTERSSIPQQFMAIFSVGFKFYLFCHKTKVVLVNGHKLTLKFVTKHFKYLVLYEPENSMPSLNGDDFQTLMLPMLTHLHAHTLSNSLTKPRKKVNNQKTNHIEIGPFRMQHPLKSAR